MKIKKCLLMISYFLLSNVAFAQSKIGATQPVKSSIDTSQMINVFIVLIVMLLAIVFVAFLIKRLNYFGNNSHSFLKVRGGINIGPKERLVIVTVNHKQLLIGVTPTSIALLHEFESTDDASTEANHEPTTFNQFFKKALKRGGQ